MPTSRPIAAYLLDKTIGVTPIVVGTTDPRFYDRTIGYNIRS